VADTSISEAFPGVLASDLATILDDFGLTPSNTVVDLLSLGARASDVLAAIGEYLIDIGSKWRLWHIAPGLGQNSQALLPVHSLSARPANGLRRSGVSTWNELACRTPTGLMDLPGLGRKSVAEIIALALNRAAMQILLSAPGVEAASFCAAGTGDTEHDISPNLHADFSLPGFETLARWAICVGNVTTLGEALDLAESRVLPEDVVEALDALRKISLEPLSDEGSDVASAYEYLHAQCGDERQQEIFRRRILFSASTLEELGEEMSITRERVRQIQKTAEERVSTTLRRPEGSEIRWRAGQLRQELGTAISWTHAATREALIAATHGILHDTAAAESLLLWLAGPYRLDKESGWIFSEAEYVRGEVGPLSELGPPPRASLLREVTGDDGVVDVAATRSRAAAAGLVAYAVDDWIALCPFRDFDGTLVLWQGSVADKAEVLFGILKRPATADEVNDLIGERHNVRSIRNRLLGDDRFVRTDRFRMGLRRWGLEEYTGIVDEIEEEIGRHGGEADVNDLVRTLTRQFDLRSGSVVSYTTVPRFVVDNGRIHVRRANEPFVPTRTLFDEARAFLLAEHRCSYRIRVDGDVLRGSGRPLPQGVGAWLGVLPGTRRQFRFRDGDALQVSWPESALLGPALGSLRRQALARSADAGDSLLLEFDRSSDEVEAMLVRQSELEAASGWLRGTLLTGIDAGDQTEFEQLLAVGVGASSMAEVRRRCRDRGDPELAVLLPTEASHELDDALDRLREVL
jgi:Sigma-70, region 4/Bacterial RNA polymerase, alpha chain C terminal domain